MEALFPEIMPNEKRRRFYSPQSGLKQLDVGENGHAGPLANVTMNHIQRYAPARVAMSELANDRPANTPIEYNRVAADLLADVASWAYADCETLVDELHHRGIVGPEATCQQVSVSNFPMLVVSSAFLLRSGNVGVLAFRGTDPMNAINFLTDANVQAVNMLSMGHVHGGFYRNFRAVWFDLVQHVEQAIADSDDSRRMEALYITGHSLGAAMAVLAGAFIYGDNALSHWRDKIRGIYTYGQPMVGDSEFASVCKPRFGHMLFPHVYEHDLVPHMPPMTTGRFEHFGQEYVGSAEGWAPRSQIAAQALTAFMSVPASMLAWVNKQVPLLSWVRLPYSIDDHSPNAYLQAFRAARD